MSTSTLERPKVDEREQTQDDTPKFFHYVKKDQIVESAAAPIAVALCGETFPVTKQAKPGSPVCPECEEIYQSLRKK